jgi:hypothetical protein
MRIALSVLLFVAVGVATVPAVGQPSPSGTWVATKEAPAELPPAPGAIFGERFGIAMSADAVTLTRPTRGNSVSVVTVHPLDGTEVAVVQPGRPCFGDTIQGNVATRRDNSFDFSVVSVTPPGGATTPLSVIYKFHPAGDTLTVESTIRDANGPRQVGTVYRRSNDPLPPALAAPNVTVAAATIADLAWLAGDWVGTVGNNAVEERWMVPAGGAMIGNSRSTRSNGTQMVEFEYLCIAQRAGGLVYTAMPNGSGATDFLATKVSADSITFENPDHDFPRAITYTKRADGGIDATISGAPGQRSLTYSFTRK